MNKVSLIKELSILFLVTSGFFVLVATHNFFAALFLFLSSLLIEKFFKKIHANRNKKITEIVQKARVELDTGNHQKMSFLFQKAIELDPNNCLLYYEYGNCNLEVNNYHKALNSFNQSLKINPKFTPAYLSRARAYFHLKDYKRALHDCN